MARTKRVLSLLLSLVLGAALFAPAVAADGAALDPYAPVIMKQPKEEIYQVAAYPRGRNFTLEVEARLPEGVDGVLSYAWYDFDWTPESMAAPVAVGAKLELPIPEKDIELTYCAVVTNTYVDPEDGETKTAYVKSVLVKVDVTKNFLSLIPFLWRSKGVWGYASTILFSPFILLGTLGLGLLHLEFGFIGWMAQLF